MSSLGFVSGQRMRPPIVPTAPHLPEEKTSPSSFSCRVASQMAHASLNLGALVWIGVVLKWPLALGDDPGHAHPHIDAEDYIHDANAVMSLAFALFCLDWLDIVANACRARRVRRYTLTLSTAALGGAIALILPLALLQDGFSPGSDPPRRIRLYEDHELIAYSAFVALASLSKWSTTL